MDFTPLNALLDQVLMQIRDDLSKRPRNKYCHFHWDHGYDTLECYNLKQQIEALFKQRKLQWFIKGGENPQRDPEPNRRAKERPKAPLEEMRVIVGGNTMVWSSKKARKMYLCMVQSVQISGWPTKVTRIDNLAINFTEEDIRQLHHPHDNALVISLSMQTLIPVGYSQTTEAQQISSTTLCSRR